MKPLRGLQPRDSSCNLVRNPDYDQATDDRARENYPDKFDFVINANADDIFDQDRGRRRSRTTSASETGRRSCGVHEDPRSRRACSRSTPATAPGTSTMNLTQPPFDDIHVRKAANLVMDKTGLRPGMGRPDRSATSRTTSSPTTMSQRRARGLRPVPEHGRSGDEEAAKAEMAQSKYDTDQDGICDAPECKERPARHRQHRRATRRWSRSSSSRSARSASRSRPATIEDAYHVHLRPSEQTSRCAARPGWGKDYADAYTFYLSAVRRPGDHRRTATYNYSLVGITPRSRRRRSGSRARRKASRASTRTSTSARHRR